MIDIHRALTITWGNCKFEQRGNDYSGLNWLDTETAKPTEAEMLAEIARLTVIEENTQYKKLRAAEYPNFRDYLDGIVKGDQEQIQEYIDACLAVKAKYPKPE
jgi:hypothetical protein